MTVAKDSDSASGGGSPYVPGLGGDQPKNPPSPLARRGRRLKNLRLDRVDLVHAGANQPAKVKLFKADLDAEQSKTPAEVEKAATDADGFGAGDYAYTPDLKTPTSWKLRLTATPGGTPDARIVGAALAALGPAGFRGNKVQIPSGDLVEVKARVKSAWLKANPDRTSADVPTVLKGRAIIGGMNMDLTKIKDESVRKHLEDLAQTNGEAAQAMFDALTAEPATSTPVVDEVAKSEFAKLEKSLEDERAARAATEVRLAKMEAEAARSGFVAVAKADLETLGKAEDVGALLFEISSKVDADVYKSLEQLLKGAAAQLEDTQLFKQVAGLDDRGEGTDEVTKLAKGLVDAGAAETMEQATIKVLNQHPELYRQYRDAR